LPSIFAAPSTEPNPAADRGLCGGVEDLVALAGLVADVFERQQQVRAGLDRLVVHAGLVADRLRQFRDPSRGDVRDTARGLDDGVGGRANLLRLTSLNDRVLDELDRNSGTSSSHTGSGSTLERRTEPATGLLARGVTRLADRAVQFGGDLATSPAHDRND
jgi:hypothetical protein